MIQPTRKADLPALMALWNPLIRETLITFSTEQKSLTGMETLLADKSRSGHGFFTAFQDGTPVGFATYGPFRNGNGYARTMEHTIILGAGARGRGLGRALMTALESHALARGAHSMIAGVSSGNPEGRAFHAAIGYADTATIPAAGFKFDLWWDLWLMQKFLT